MLTLNLLGFIDMVDVMSYGGDARGNPPQRGGSRLPTQSESCKC